MQEDTTPWYKQFWPWFLIALPAAAVVASLYTVSLAIRTGDSLVTAAPDGMDVVSERNARAARRAAELGLDARIVIDAGSGAIRTTLSSAAGVDTPPVLSLLLSHPTDVRRDLRVELYRALPDPDGTPAWVGHVTTVPSGRRYAVLTPSGGAADSWRLYGEWSGGSELELAPPGDASD